VLEREPANLLARRGLGNALIALGRRVAIGRRAQLVGDVAEYVVSAVAPEGGAVDDGDADEGGDGRTRWR
jgi:hypothetical protein